MKIVITGHTSGLGKSFYNFLEKNNHEVIGLSRTTGFDLDLDLETFLLEDWHIYINNAYSGFKQTELLYKLFEKNKHRSCIILNIGSVSADGNYDTENKYAVHKSSLDKACMQLQLIDSECKVIQVKLGRMKTNFPLIKNKKKYPMMDTTYLAKYITQNILFCPEDIYFKNLTIDIMHSRKILDINKKNIS